VDRGPYSLLVLEKVAQLINAGYQVYPLRGNHEQILLDLKRRALYRFAKRQYTLQLLSKKRKLLPGIKAFLQAMPYYYETDTAYLVHAGFNHRLKKPLKGWRDMLWIRDFKYSKKKLKGKTVYHGHVPIKLDQVKADLKKNSNKIDLDNGCVRAEIDGYGKLLCLNIDSGKLYSQKNVDMVGSR
jgi:serine/threonine protein phosphatase 1